MVVGMEAVLLATASAKKLAKFYKDVVGLKQKEVMEIGEKGEEGYEFDLGKGPSLYILDHSKIKGVSKDPSRVMFNLEVKDIEKSVKDLKKKGAKLVQDIYHVQDYGYVATFKDVDGNYFQLVKTRPYLLAILIG